MALFLERHLPRARIATRPGSRKQQKRDSERETSPARHGSSHYRLTPLRVLNLSFCRHGAPLQGSAVPCSRRWRRGPPECAGSGDCSGVSAATRTPDRPVISTEAQRPRPRSAVRRASALRLLSVHGEAGEQGSETSFCYTSMGRWLLRQSRACELVKARQGIDTPCCSPGRMSALVCWLCCRRLVRAREGLCLLEFVFVPPAAADAFGARYASATCTSRSRPRSSSCRVPRRAIL